MIAEIDIWRSAHILAKRHGEDAGLRAAERADELLAAGDLDGAATWRRILAAVQELQSLAPADGASVH